VQVAAQLQGRTSKSTLFNVVISRTLRNTASLVCMLVEPAVLYSPVLSCTELYQHLHTSLLNMVHISYENLIKDLRTSGHFDFAFAALFHVFSISRSKSRFNIPARFRFMFIFSLCSGSAADPNLSGGPGTLFPCSIPCVKGFHHHMGPNG
jgi:hypothetical protein